MSPSEGVLVESAAMNVCRLINASGGAPPSLLHPHHPPSPSLLILASVRERAREVEPSGSKDGARARELQVISKSASITGATGATGTGDTFEPGLTEAERRGAPSRGGEKQHAGNQQDEAAPPLPLSTPPPTGKSIQFNQ